MKKLLNTAFIYLLLSVIFEVVMAGIVEASATLERVGNIVVRPMGLIVHTHLLMLGFFFFLIVIFAEKIFSITSEKKFKLFFEIYNIGLLISIVIIAYRSFAELFSYEVNKMLAMGVGTLGHVLLTIGLFLFFYCFKNAVLKSYK